MQPSLISTSALVDYRELRRTRCKSCREMDWRPDQSMESALLRISGYFATKSALRIVSQIADTVRCEIFRGHD
jgi:hypothetical protein